LNQIILSWILLLTVAASAQAAEVVVAFDTPEQSEMYHALLKEYRCLKCQNQNLADSNASLAGDLRREIRDQILAGKNKKDIDEYLVNRYGEFVMYRPPFNTKTAVLWVGPFILLALAIGSLLIMIRKQQALGSSVAKTHDELDAVAQQKLDRAKQLLGK